MTIPSRFYNLLILCAAIAMSSCVTVNLGNSNGKKADGVEYKAPAKPFASDPRDDVDQAWKNPANGNTISYLSDCNDPSDPPLDLIVQGVITGLTELKIHSQTNPTIAGREGRRVLASGKVDGVPSQIDLLVFKRNSCIYILNYAGVNTSFHDDHAAFDSFISGFKAP